MITFVCVYNSNNTSRTSTPERISSAERLARQSSFGAAAVRKGALELIQNDVNGNVHIDHMKKSGGGGVASNGNKVKSVQRMHRGSKNGLRLTKSAGMTGSSNLASSTTNPLPPIVPRQKTPPTQLQIDVDIDDALSNYEKVVKKSMSLESKAPLGGIGAGGGSVQTATATKGKRRHRQRQAHTAPAVSRSLQQLPPMSIDTDNDSNPSSLSTSIDNSMVDV